MRLLIFTQAMDSEDPFVGFFVAWVEMLASRVEHIEVICLKEGKHALPENVRVHSLGKEERHSRVQYVIRLARYLWALRHSYDTVLVHMNPEYLLFAGWYWRLRGIPTALWYNHPYHGIRLSLAARLANKIFYTSPYAATAHFAKAQRMPAGIDTDLFHPGATPHERTHLYMQGRVAPSKRVHVALEALRILRATVPNATLTLVGPEDPVYGKELRRAYADLVLARAVTFVGPLAHKETPSHYARAGVALNLAAAGHFDKTVLEPMACETPVVLSSQAFADLVPAEWIVPEEDPQALAETIARLIALSPSDYAALGAHGRAQVEKLQSLKALGDRLVKELHAVP